MINIRIEIVNRAIFDEDESYRKLLEKIPGFMNVLEDKVMDLNAGESYMFHCSIFDDDGLFIFRPRIRILENEDDSNSKRVLMETFEVTGMWS